MAGKGNGSGTREAVYKRQLQALGVWEDAFEPELKLLAQLEREEARTKKAWSATAEVGEDGKKGAPDPTHPLYEVLSRQRRDILAHREALGLTPKGLRKLRGATPQGPSEKELIAERLDLIAQRVGEYGPCLTSAE